MRENTRESSTSPDAFWFSAIGPMCRLVVVNENRPQGGFFGKTKRLANDRSTAELLKRVCMDNSDSRRRTRRSQQIKHVEDLPLEVLFIENVQIQNVLVF